jgi:hypothetical protein
MTVRLRDDIVEVLRQLAADSSPDSLLLGRLEPDDDMLTAGMDPPRIQQLVSRIEEAYAVKFEEQELSLIPPITLGSIAARILQKTGVLSYCMIEESCGSRTIR